MGLIVMQFHELVTSFTLFKARATYLNLFDRAYIGTWAAVERFKIPLFMVVMPYKSYADFIHTRF
jgi:hypothetical protein